MLRLRGGLAHEALRAAGEAVGEEVGAWGAERLGAPVIESRHDVRLIDGGIAVRAEGDPTVFLGYWQDPEATAAKVAKGSVRTGDLAVAPSEQEDGR